MNRWGRGVWVLLSAVLIAVAMSVTLVGCEEEKEIYLPPFSEEDSRFNGIGGLPIGGGGGIGGGQVDPDAGDAGTDVEAGIPDSGEIEMFPDGG